LPISRSSNTGRPQVIIGVSNLWVQSGIKARDVVLFSMLLALFDFFATALSPLTFTLFARLQTAPLTPALAWMSNSAILGGGLGDFVLVTVFSLSLYKAFGRTAGVINTLFSLLVIASLLLVNQEWPGMIFLAPLMLVQYLSGIIDTHKNARCTLISSKFNRPLYF
jgi:hypothetical protein